MRVVCFVYVWCLMCHVLHVSRYLSCNSCGSYVVVCDLLFDLYV